MTENTIKKLKKKCQAHIILSWCLKETENIGRNSAQTESNESVNQKQKYKETSRISQFQSYHDSFGQAFERGRIYLFYNKGQAIQLLEANFEGIAKQLQMYI